MAHPLDFHVLAALGNEGRRRRTAAERLLCHRPRLGLRLRVPSGEMLLENASGTNRPRRVCQRQPFLRRWVIDQGDLRLPNPHPLPSIPHPLTPDPQHPLQLASGPAQHPPDEGKEQGRRCHRATRRAHPHILPILRVPTKRMVAHPVKRSPHQGMGAAHIAHRLTQTVTGQFLIRRDPHLPRGRHITRQIVETESPRWRQIKHPHRRLKVAHVPAVEQHRLAHKVGQINGTHGGTVRAGGGGRDHLLGVGVHSQVAQPTITAGCRLKAT